MTFRFAGFDFGSTSDHGMPFVVPNVLSRDVGSHHVVLIAIVPVDLVLVVVVSGVFSIVDAHPPGGAVGLESGC